MKSFKIHIALFLLITVSIPNTVLSLHFLLHNHHCENHTETDVSNEISFTDYKEHEICLICEQEFFTQYSIPQVIEYSTLSYFLENIDFFNQENLETFNYLCAKLRAPPIK